MKKYIRHLPEAIALVLIVMLSISGCIGRTVVQEPPPPTPIITSPQNLALPTFPGNSDPGLYSAIHSSSSTDTDILGIDRIDEGGDNNYEDPPIDALVIAPGDNDDLAYAVYNLAGLGVDRPVNINLGVDSAPFIPGGEDPLMLRFWIGLSNYTEFSWEWFGPFEESQSLVLNSPTVLERYIGSSGIMYYCVATLPDEEFVTPENPDGLIACQINLGTVTVEDATSPAYNETKPLFVPIESHTPSALPPKGSSALDPAQYVTLNWTHRADAQSPPSGAAKYKVYRQGAGDAAPVLIGSVDSPANAYVDPTNNLPTMPEPVPGETYTYYLRGWNDQGHTAMSSFKATILDLDWVHTWGLNGNDEARGIVFDNDGDVYTAGLSRAPDGPDNLLVMGYTADGTLKFKQIWGELDNESAFGICGDRYGNKFITGTTRSISGQTQLVLLRYLDSDILSWDITWGVDDSAGLAVTCDPDGLDIYVTGSIIEGQNNIIMLRLDQNGNIVTLPQAWGGRWADYTNNKSATGQDIAINNNFEVFIVGGYSTEIGNNDAVVLMVNPDRTLAWAKTWGTPANDEARAIALDPVDGSIYMTGWHNNDQFMLVKFDSAGDVVWEKAWAEPGKTGQGNDLALHGNSVYVVGDNQWDAVLLEFDQVTGELLSQAVWGDLEDYETANAIATHPSVNALMIAGISFNATSEWITPAGVATDISNSSMADIPFVYDGGHNNTNSLEFPKWTPAGIEDAGAGANDNLLMRVQP